jgi:hypothetical protein
MVPAQGAKRIIGSVPTINKAATAAGCKRLTSAGFTKSIVINKGERLIVEGKN